MDWKPGTPFRALDTAEVRRAGIVPGSGGEVTSVLGAKVSFYLDRGGPGAGFIQAHSNFSSFNANFALDKSKETVRRSYQDSRVYPQEFPRDFLKK
ncbi:MAG TPA: hypothetical protein VIE43_01010 [Thermoanaerobaculia bacterium]|jgi:hypothetical protein|nr:hypothetical protein [Thermoanaerobaculia bacterium]